MELVRAPVESKTMPTGHFRGFAGDHRTNLFRKSPTMGDTGHYSGRNR
ncbi:hypothetical protein [Actinomadura meyerae]|jgi:hypothetical protein|nr:hypothetical protein [Actinomadura meyerae]